MREMQTIVTDVSGVCLSVSLSRSSAQLHLGVLLCILIQVQKIGFSWTMQL